MTNNTTDKKTQGVPLRKEASADDPIYTREFSIGTRHAANSSPDTTRREPTPPPSEVCDNDDKKPTPE